MAAYYFARTIDSDVNQAVERTTHALKEHGFGVLTDIDISATLKNKIGVEFRPYRILGACNPGFAHRALLAEDKIGTMLPCNVVLQEVAPGRTEVAAVDPVASMQGVSNDDLGVIAGQVRDLLRQAINAI